MSYRNCQNPYCHFYDTQDRIRGSKGSKVYATRNSTNYFGIACTFRCLHEFWEANMDAIVMAVPPMQKKSRPINSNVNWTTKTVQEIKDLTNDVG